MKYFFSPFWKMTFQNFLKSPYISDWDEKESKQKKCLHFLLVACSGFAWRELIPLLVSSFGVERHHFP